MHQRLTKYGVLLAALLLLLCLGSLYAWSSLTPQLTKNYGFSAVQTQSIFGVLIGVFTISMVFAGRNLERRGPRPFLYLCALFLFGGFGLASFSRGNFAVLFCGISILVGTATGLGYVTALTVCMKWFPVHKGFITGIAMAAFGLGAILLANIASYQFSHGADVSSFFLKEGILFSLVAVVAALIVRFPASGDVKHGTPSLMPNAPLKDPFLWALAAAMFSGTFGGLVVIGNLTAFLLEKGMPLSAATMAVSAFSLGNAAGRVFWGTVVDRFGKSTIYVSLLFLSVLIHFLIYRPSASTFAMILETVVAFGVGFGFGASFVVHAALTASRYGVNRVAEIYPLIFLAYGVAGISGPPLGGLLRDLTSTYTASIGVAVAVVLMGVVLSGFLMRSANRAAV